MSNNGGSFNQRAGSFITNLVGGCFLVIVVLVGGFFLMVKSYENFGPRPLAPDVERELQAKADQESELRLNPLKITSWEWHSDDHARYIVGVVTNRSLDSFKIVSIDLALLDESDSRVGNAFDIITGLGPGETWKFKALVLEDRARRFRLSSLKFR